MIDSLFQSGTDQALDDQLQRPAPFKPDEPKLTAGQLLKAPFQGIASGSTKSAAFAAEMSGAFGEVEGATGAFNRGGMFSLPTDDERKQQEAARRKLVDQGGPSYSNPAGDQLRQAAKDIMPDPTSTHAATQVVAGVAEFATQAVGYTALGGPVAPALLAGDVGLAEADKLKQQGVDMATRAKAGAVAGITAGASIAIPVAVPGSIAKTAAAVAVGGPGGFIAQNAAERAILANAGYKDIANQYDPFDPVGLALSTIVPAGFGAVAVRGARVAPKAPITLKEVVLGIESNGQRYAKDGSVLTSPKGAKGEMQVMDATNLDPGFGVRPAADNSLAERARVGSDYLDAMLKRYGGDEAKAMAAYNAGPGALDAALKKGGNWLDHMPAETQAYVAKGLKRLGGERSDAVGRAAVARDPEAVAAARVNQTASMVDSLRLTPDTDLAGMTRHADAVESAHAMLARGELVVVGDLIRAEVAPAADHPFTAWQQQIDGALTELRAARQPQVAEIARVEPVKPVDGVAPIERVDGSQNVRATGKTSPFQAVFDELAPQLTDKKPGQVAAELKQTNKLSPLANNAIIGLSETGGDPKRIAQLIAHADAMAKATPNRPVADVMADAVEKMRAGEPAPNEAARSPVTDMAAQIEQATPDLPVRVDADGRRGNAREELEAIRKEAAEGTDTTLGANDASLLQVAAHCFLTSGGL